MSYDAALDFAQRIVDDPREEAVLEIANSLCALEASFTGRKMYTIINDLRDRIAERLGYDSENEVPALEPLMLELLDRT